MREIQGLLAGNLPILNHPCKRDRQCCPARLRSLVSNLLPIDFRSIGIEVSSKKSLLWIPLQKITDYLTQLSRRDKPGLLGEVRIDIRFHEKVGGVLGEWSSAAMEQHKRGFAQRSVAQ